MVEMGGLEPPTPYMRSNKSVLSKPFSMRVFCPLSRFLPSVLPLKTVSRIVSKAILA